MKGKVLIAAPVHEVLTKGLEAAGYELLHAEQITQEKGYELIRDCCGVITSTRLLLDKALIDAAPGLEFIGRMGSGMEVIDVAYAAARNIACFSSPEGNCNAVAEHALGMLLNLTKRINVSQNEIREGKWLREENRGSELEGKTIAIIGYGHTGKAFARKLLGFDMTICVYDKYQVTAQEPHIRVCTTLEDIYRADIVSFHVPIHEDTFHYFGRNFLDRMQQPFILVNTSRGEVVDNRVLLEGVLEGKITGACIDVWEEEPLARMSQTQRSILQQLAVKDNIVLTPHIAGYSHEALYKMSRILLEKIILHSATN